MTTTSASPRRSTSSDSASIAYLAALDGIRGLGVALVFAFHAGYDWASGGFLGVSVFFTLSGFLITTLLLRESLGTGSVDLARFWTRRLRRLLPAAYATLVFVLVISPSAPWSDPGALRIDFVAAIGNVANWHFLFSGDSYSDLFRTPSPVLHFWSLAIEEQFYLLFPLAVWLALRARRRRRTSSASAGRRTDPRSTIRWIAIGGIAISCCATLIAARAGGSDFVYYSLPTRAAEILVGSLAATYAGIQRLPGRKSQPWLTALGLAALAGIVMLSGTSTTTSGWIGDGGLTLFAILSCALVVSALARGPVASIFGFAPLRALGQISYGVYLFHWPVILWLTPERVGVHGDLLVAIDAAVTLVLATASFLLLEQPVRRGRLLTGARARAAVPAAIASIAVLTVLTTATMQSGSTVVDFEAARRTVDERVADSATPRGSESTQSLRIAFFGDSTALIQTLGFTALAESDKLLTLVAGDSGLGCGIGRDGLVRNPFDHRVTPARFGCGDWVTTWGPLIETERPDIAVIQVGAFDVADRQLPGETVWRRPSDPTYGAHLRGELLRAVDLFEAAHVRVAVLTAPHIDVDQKKVPRPSTPSPENDPARIDRFNEIVAEVARQRPGVLVIDFAGWLRRQPGGEFDPGLRPDGAHLTIESAERAARWLDSEIFRATTADLSARATEASASTTNRGSR